jgi:hypothetical protein
MTVDSGIARELLDIARTASNISDLSVVMCQCPYCFRIGIIFMRFKSLRPSRVAMALLIIDQAASARIPVCIGELTRQAMGTNSPLAAGKSKPLIDNLAAASGMVRNSGDNTASYIALIPVCAKGSGGESEWKSLMSAS